MRFCKHTKAHSGRISHNRNNIIRLFTPQLSKQGIKSSLWKRSSTWSDTPAHIFEQNSVFVWCQYTELFTVESWYININQILNHTPQVRFPWPPPFKQGGQRSGWATAAVLKLLASGLLYNRRSKSTRWGEAFRSHYALLCLKKLFFGIFCKFEITHTLTGEEKNNYM